jgi:hypothetical protein
VKKIHFLIFFITLYIQVLNAKTASEAIKVITSYAQTGAEAPLLSDYLDIGIIEIHEGNVAGINDAVLKLEYNDVDTQEEIQAVVDGYNQMIYAFLTIITDHILSSPTAKDMAFEKITAYAGDNTLPAPTIEDYSAVSVSGVSSSNLDEVNAIIASGTPDVVDSTEEIQQIVDDVLASDTAPPVITSENNITLLENILNVMTVTAEDNTTVSFGISGGEDHTLFSIGEQTGKLVFLDVPNFESPKDSDQDNKYKLEINASDELGNSVLQLITVTILDDTTTNDPIDMDTSNMVQRLGTPSTLDIKVNLGSEERKLYILLTNYSPSTAASVSIEHNAKILGSVSTESSTLYPSKKRIKNKKRTYRHSPIHVSQFNHDALVSLHRMPWLKKRRKVSSSDSTLSTDNIVRNDRTEGESESFEVEEDTSVSTDATLKKVISNITTAFGTKTLNIWVSDDTFEGDGCVKSTCVTQEMVNTLADKFLKDGDDNDIYDWVTNIYGEEWGADASAKYTNLIGESDEINILLTDIDNDDSKNGGTVGYFYAKDNYTKESVSGSNEMVMFYVDSVMYANTDAGDYWQKAIYQTLAHEFQHMINFYQGGILRDVSMDAWLNEMLSETTEDLVATKLQVDGPRAVSYLDGSAGETGNTDGRYPDFNSNNTRTLPQWRNDMADYSKVSAFGTFLIRNYGGAEVLHNIVHGTEGNETAIEDAVNALEGVDGKAFGDILREWGVGVLLSDVTDLNDTMPRYNAGEFTYTTYNTITYDLGSINFFNYDPEPLVSRTTGDVNPEANYYYLVGEGLSGVIDINLTLNSTTEATLIVK